MDGFEAIEKGLGLTGAYRIERVIGEGGMGTVYRAEQLELRRMVALKVLAKAFLGEEEVVRHFLAEAKLAARVVHPNVVRVLDAGRSALGLFIVFELVDGRSLRARMDRGLSPRQAAGFALQTARGLTAIHEAGIVHRDVKPENLLIDPDDGLKILDLGVAKDLLSTQRTASGFVFGTRTYMAPEQWQGREVTPAADVYSLGVVLYEMLARRPPYGTDDMMEIVMIRKPKAPPAPSSLNSDVPPEWDEVVARSLEPKPADRYRSAAEFALVLERLAGGTGGVVGAALPEEPVQPAGRRARAKSSGTPPPEASAERGPSAGRGQGRAPQPPRAAGPASPGRARPLAVAGLLCAAAVLGGAGTLWLQRPLERRAVPATTRPQTGARTAATTAAQPAADAVLSQLQKSVARETVLAPWILEKHPGRAAAGEQAWLARFFVIDAAQLLAPVIRARLPGASGGAAAASPFLAAELEAGRPSAPLAMAPDAARPTERAWVAPLPPGWIQEGFSHIALRAPAALTDSKARWEISLRFERPAGYPAATVALGVQDGSAGCPADSVLQSTWRDYRTGKVGNAEAALQRILKEQPGCGSAMLQRALLLFRAWQERHNSGDGYAMVIISEMVLGLGWMGEVPVPELREAWMRQTNSVLGKYPRWPSAWSRLGERMRDSKMLEPGERSCRWAVLLEPRIGGNWLNLADTELRFGPSDTMRARLALDHAQRGMDLLASRPDEIWPGAYYVYGKALALAGRASEAKVAFERALWLNPAMLEATRALKALRK